MHVHRAPGLHVLAGLIAFVFGIASFRLAGYVIWPFGRTVVWKREAGVWSLIGNIVWILVLGWELAVAHVVAGLLLCVTIVGIPLGLAAFKMVPLALLPLGREVVPLDAVPHDPYGVPATR